MHQGDGWSVFVVDGNRIRRVTVEVGQRNAEEAEIRSGLDTGRQVVVRPSDQAIDGAPIEIRAGL